MTILQAIHVQFPFSKSVSLKRARTLMTVLIGHVHPSFLIPEAANTSSQGTQESTSTIESELSVQLLETIEKVIETIDTSNACAFAKAFVHFEMVFCAWKEAYKRFFWTVYD